jgi:hypothetical protein
MGKGIDMSLLALDLDLASLCSKEMESVGWVWFGNLLTSKLDPFHSLRWSSMSPLTDSQGLKDVYSVIITFLKTQAPRKTWDEHVHCVALPSDRS